MLPHFAETIGGRSSAIGGLEVPVMMIVATGFGPGMNAVLNEVDVRP
jgi:hypothetical protein